MRYSTAVTVVLLCGASVCGRAQRLKSVGKWEGDTLVVDAVGFNGRSWLDAMGHQHSDAMRITERNHRRDFGHMEVQISIDDPKTFTRPFTIKFNQALLPDTDLIESFCSEDEKDVGHLVAK